jgi:hypothetical protein
MLPSTTNKVHRLELSKWTSPRATPKRKKQAQSEAKNKKPLTKIKRQAMDHWTTQPEWDTLTLGQQQWLERELQGTTDGREDDASEGQASVERERSRGYQERKAWRREAKCSKAKVTWHQSYREPAADSSTDDETGNQTEQRRR